jgi:putative Ca2+/H+ antiporter (TMEM165/GDT1 family)
MEALVPAFIAALLTQPGDRPALLAAILADRYGKPLTVALGAGLAHALGNAVAALGGGAVAPLLTPAAQSMLLAVALVLNALSTFMPVRTPARLEQWRMGALLTSFLGIFSLALGDRTQFFTFAIGGAGQPWFAAAGATAGCFAVSFIAAVTGELAWASISFRIFRVVTGLGFLAGGAWLGLAAARLL